MKTDAAVVAAAEAAARRIHARHVDPTGAPYTSFLAQVVQRLAADEASPDVIAAAWLYHSVDTGRAGMAELFQEGIPGRVLAVVAKLCRKPGDTTELWLRRSRATPAAARILAAVAAVDSDPVRLAAMPEDRRRAAARLARSILAPAGRAPRPSSGRAPVAAG